MEKTQQSGGSSVKRSLDSETKFNKTGEHVLDDGKSGTVPGCRSESESGAIKSEAANLPLSDDGIVGPFVTLLLTNDNFEFLLIDSAEDVTDIVANTDFHAFFIKDAATSLYLDQYDKASADLWKEDPPARGSNMQTQKSSELFLPLVERLRNKSPHTKVLFTIKKKVPIDLCVRARNYIGRLCDNLGLSAHDKKLITVAGDIHNLAKRLHPDHYPTGFKGMMDANDKLLRFLNEKPVLLGILRSMYSSLGKKNFNRPSLELLGANVLTIADLFCDTFRLEKHLTRDGLNTIGQTLRNLSGLLFLNDVVETFIAMLEDEVSGRVTHEKSDRVMIYSDRPEQIYPLAGRLRNEGFQTTTAKSLESFVMNCRRQPPDMIIIRLHSQPIDVMKKLHYLLRKGIDFSSTPAFLLVKSNVVQRLISLHEMGFEDIIDVDSNIDVLFLKIKKVRAQFEASSKLTDKSLELQSGTRGNLSDMNLIDLLQAMGPSQRTARLTISQKESSSNSLIIYLAHGNIIFAQLGDLLGENAIYHALGWEEGTWVVEQITDEDLPESNNNLPNEAILMEGCRLLDENARKTKPVD